MSIQLGGDSQNTMPVAINAGLSARQIAKTVVTDPNAAKFSMDAFKKSIANPGALLDATTRNLPLSDALAQQGFMTRMAAKIPFVRSFLGPDFILNEAIGTLGKDALNGLSKAQVTKIALEGGDVARNLIKAGMPADAAEALAKKGIERLAATGGTAVAQTTGRTVARAAAVNVVDDLATEAAKLTMKKGFEAASQEAVKKALQSPNSLEALKDLGFYVKDAKSLVAKAATSGAETAAKVAATEAGQTVAASGAKQAAGGIKGFFGKLLSGAKGNFVVAGIFSLASNGIQLAQGKMSIKEFAALTVVDTAAYGAIGWGSAAAGAALGTALFPGVGTVAGFVIGLGLGFLGGTAYEKVIRNPLRSFLGGNPSGGADPAQYNPASYNAPAAGNTPGSTAPPSNLTYEQALREIESLSR